jgi:hypothetical protein
MEMRGDAAARQGADKIITQCLGLGPADSLCVFCDETTENVADVLISAADRLHVRPKLFQVPVSEQRRYSKQDNIPQEFLTALQDSRGILTCLSADTESTGFRRRLLRLGVNEGTRFGHMPGANMQLLATAANIDYEEAAERCEQIAYAMDIGVKCVLYTYEFDSQGRILGEHRLSMSLGGPGRLPITSTGMIASNTWGNIPGGETFIAPIEDVSDGTFVLNGSLKDRVCSPGQHLILRFEEGSMREVTGDPALRTYLLGMIEPALANGDRFADCLAELGVGVNIGITELNGTPLIDEKCAGTAHIALGDNERYGGLHPSNIHEDLITLAPSLTINDKPILSRGDYRFDSSEWFQPLSSIELRPEFLTPNCCVRRKAGVVVDTSAGLRTVRLVSAGRRGRYRISTREDAEVLAQIWNLLPFFPNRMYFDQIARAMPAGKASPQVLRAALQVLNDHGLVGLLANGGGEPHA